MNRSFDFSIGEYYHLYNRGTDKRIIFTNRNDHNRFVLLLHLCNGIERVDVSNKLREGQTFTELINIEFSDRLVDIVAYCLMPNHFHLLVREKQEDGISLFMKKLLTAYSMYFNNKNNRTGALFEGRFKAKHANTDEYLKYLFAYIHLNPIKIIDSKWKEKGIQNLKTAQNFLNNYEHSSYLDWMGNDRHESKILNRDASPEYFSTVKDFNDFVNEWLTFKDVQ